MMSIEVVIERLKDSHLFILTFVIVLILIFLGAWSTIYNLVGFDNLVAIAVLLILALTLSALVVFSLSFVIQFRERKRDYDKLRKSLKEKEGKKAKKMRIAQRSSPNLSGDYEIKRREELNKGEKFEKREKDFLESHAYQYLFNYVRSMIKENNISIFGAKDKLGNLLDHGGENHKALDLTGGAKFNDLRIMLAKKRFYFSEEEFEILVERELIRQAYEDFRKFMLSSNPQNLRDYVLAFFHFIKEYENPESNYQELTQKFFSGHLDTYYLEKILEEQKIDYTKRELYDRTKDVGESLSEFDY